MARKKSRKTVTKPRATAPNKKHVVVIGTPIEQSLSPLLHNAVFHVEHLPYEMVSFDPGGEEGFRRFMTELQTGKRADKRTGLHGDSFIGANITYPYKALVSEFCDELEETAALSAAANVVGRTRRDYSERYYAADAHTGKALGTAFKHLVFGWDHSLYGFNTDGAGFLSALSSELALDASVLHRVVIAGTGGVGRAIAVALGATVKRNLEITFIVRDRARAAQHLELLTLRKKPPFSYQVFTVKELIASDAGSFDLFVNATPQGMEGSDDIPVPLSWLVAHARAVFDCVYRRVGTTPLVTAARASGLAATDGLGMLIEQAILSQQIWNIDLDPAKARATMWEALRAEGMGEAYEER